MHCNIQVNLRHMGRKCHEKYLIRKQFDHIPIQENARLSFPLGTMTSLALYLVYSSKNELSGFYSESSWLSIQCFCQYYTGLYILPGKSLLCLVMFTVPLRLDQRNFLLQWVMVNIIQTQNWPKYIE